MPSDYSNVTHYLAIIDAGQGAGSWAHDEIALEAINRVVRIAHSDWHFATGAVHIYDLSNADRFTTGPQPRNSETREPLPYLYSVTAKFEQAAKKVPVRKKK